MSTGSKQTTIDGRDAETIQTPNHVNGAGAVLWEVGADERVPNDVETQLQEVYRRCVDRGVLDGGDGA